MILKCEGCGAGNRVPAGRLADRPKCGRCKTPLTAPATPVEVGEADFEEVTRDSPWPVLVDVWAPWCGPCRQVAPELAQLARKHQGRLLVVKVNADEEPATAAKLGVRGIPTFVLYRGGREARRASGAMSAAQLERTLLAA